MAKNAYVGLRLVLLLLLPLAFFACTEGQSLDHAGCEGGGCGFDGDSGVFDTDTEPFHDQPGCPDDPFKENPGICGCGVPDEDDDGDGYMNCVDQCADDPNKLNPGICGCGVSDGDTDKDGLIDCMEECPEDPQKTEGGLCGCGIPDRDSDGDGYLDCMDDCPQDAEKLEPGNCGCGKDEAEWLLDGDHDSVPDCVDGCKNDFSKTDPGVCGCGVPETDSDGDGTPDCKDQCPSDGSKSEPGKCGCGVSENDGDGDGTPDCLDDCPADPQKTEPLRCGCGYTETDCLYTVVLDVEDAMVNQSLPSTNYNGTSMSIDLANNPGITYVLMSPVGLDLIPKGAELKSAKLTVKVFDSGNKVSIRRLLGSFSESKVTYNSAPSRGVEEGTMSGKKGSQSADVLSIAQAWVNGESPFGVALYPTGDDGVDIHSSEAAVDTDRPKFTIEYYD